MMNGNFGNRFVTPADTCPFYLALIPKALILVHNLSLGVKYRLLGLLRQSLNAGNV